jgi:hypothetical protein
MPCYRDEKPPSPTPDTVDEGANLGDAISFTINGIPATPVPVTLNGTPAPPSTTVIWTSFSDRWEVDLHVVAPPPPPVPVGGYTVPVNRLEILMPWLGLVTLPSRC